MKLNSNDFLEKTGVTYRQLMYWVDNEIIPAVKEKHHGERRRLYFDPEDVKKAKILGRISKGMGGSYGGPLHILKRVYENYDLGYILLDDEILISWEEAL